MIRGGESFDVWRATDDALEQEEEEAEADRRERRRRANDPRYHWVAELHGYYDTDSECEESNMNDDLDEGARRVERGGDTRRGWAGTDEGERERDWWRRVLEESPILERGRRSREVEGNRGAGERRKVGY